MKKTPLLLLLFFIFTSCGHDVYRVVKYSEAEKIKDKYTDYTFPDNEYYIVYNNSYTYIMKDTSIVFFKVDYEGKHNGYFRTIVEDKNGKKFIHDTYLDVGYYKNEYLYVNVIDYLTKRKLYRFVLDREDEKEKKSVNNLLAKME